MASHHYFRLITRWGWLAYPAVVGLIVFASLAFGLRAMTFRQNQKVVARSARLAADLTQKWRLLTQMNLPAVEGDMRWLLGVLPSERQPARLLAEVDQAATLSAVSATGFRGQKPASASAGQRLVVTLAAADLPTLARFLDTLEKMLPLIRIGDVSFQSGLAEVELEEMWRPLPQVAGDSSALVDSAQSVEKIKTRLVDFRSVVPIALASDSATPAANPNPFSPVQ